jgi:Ca2+-binding EF-hand superfamily protein
MIRNAWHISGGKGAAANSTNRRVLITRTDGTQAVEEIRNDLGLLSDDKSGMVARLQAQGLNADASNISLYGGMDTRKPGVKAAEASSIVDRLRAKAEATRAMQSPSKRAAAGATSTSVSGVSSATATAMTTEAALKIALDGPNAKSSSSESKEQPGGNSRAGSNRGRKPLPQHLIVGGVTPLKLIPTIDDELNPRKPNPGVAYLISKLVAQLKAQGDHGFTGLQRMFMSMDEDGNQTLSMAELKKALKEMEITVSEVEIRLLFDHFDRDSSGGVDFKEFIDGIRPPLNNRRLAIVNIAFTELDANGCGVVEFDKIANTYDAANHPEVIAGRLTAKQALSIFLDTFDVGGQVENMCTREEFIGYYANIGAVIESDDYFELLVRCSWRLPATLGVAAASAGGTGASAGGGMRRPTTSGGGGVGVGVGGTINGRTYTQMQPQSAQLPSAPTNRYGYGPSATVGNSNMNARPQSAQAGTSFARS